MTNDTDKALALQHFQEGRYLFEAYSKPINAQALQHFELATELDSTFGRAFSWCAYTHLENFRQNWTDNPSGSFASALDLATRAAVDVAPNDYYTQWTLASVKMLSDDFDSAWEHYEAAKSRGAGADPAFLAERAEYISCQGRPDDAIKDITDAEGLVNPIPEWYRWLKAFAYFQKEEYEVARDLLVPISSIGISNLAYILRAVSEALLRDKLAQPQNPPEAVIARLQIKDTSWTRERIERIPFQNPDDEARWQTGLRLAGLAAS